MLLVRSCFCFSERSHQTDHPRGKSPTSAQRPRQAHASSGHHPRNEGLSGGLYPHSLNPSSDLHSPHLPQQARHDSVYSPSSRSPLGTSLRPAQSTAEAAAQSPWKQLGSSHSRWSEDSTPPMPKGKIDACAVSIQACKPGPWGKNCLLSVLYVDSCSFHQWWIAQRLGEVLQATKTSNVVALGTCTLLNLPSTVYSVIKTMVVVA